MKDKELKLNASGYRDEPCYQTIKNVDAPKPGEIYIHGDTGRYVLVLNCVNGVCAILTLFEQERESRILVMGRVPMYTNPIMINYTFASSLIQYVKTITDEECLEVKKAVSDALGLLCVILDACEDNRVKVLEDENKKLRQDHDMAVAIADDLHAEQIALSKDLDKQTYKAEFYRGMYDALIDKVISARGGSVNE